MRLPGFLSRHSEFIGHVATLMSGKAIAAAIALFTTPIVARLFDPGDFGVAAVFVSTVSLVSNVASLRYEGAISLPRQEREARSLVALAMYITFGTSLCLFAGVAAARLSGSSIPPFDVLGPWAWMLPLGVLLLATLQIQEGWLTRSKLFKLSSVSLVLGNSVTSGSRILLGAVAGTSVYGLVAGYFLGTLSRVVVQRSSTPLSLRDMKSDGGWRDMRKAARDYADFPKLNAPAGLVFSLGGNLPVLLFGSMFSPAVAGLFAMANRLGHVPVTIAVSSMRRVFLQKAAAIRNRGGNLRKAFLLSTFGLAILGSGPLLLLTFFGQPIVGWLLGERWLDAGRYLEIIAPWMFMIWVTAPANPTFVVLRRQKFWLFLQIALTLLRLLAFGLAYLLAASAEWTLTAFVIATIAGNLLTITICYILIMRDAGATTQNA